MSPAPRRRVRPRWQRRPDARPAEILAAAAEVFSASGFARARLDDVARRARVSKGTLYRYFESKDALFRAMVRASVVTRLAAGEELVRTDEGTSRALLEQIIRQIWDSMRDPTLAGIIRLVHSELHEFPELARFYFDEVIVRGRHLVQSVLDRGVARGEFRADLHGFAARGIPLLMVISAQTQCFFAPLDPERLADEQVLDGILDLSLNGVAARPPAGPTA